MRLRADDLADTFGLGVAGNFAGHLEQAGEAADFVAVDAAPEAPKGIFPWHVPGSGGPLGVNPLSHDRIALPEGGGDLQLEPEVGVLLDVAYDDDGLVRAVAPRAIAAFNDCSIRRPGANKISEKKHWGPASKGLAERAFAVSELDADGATAPFRLACFLRRDGELHVYGVDSPLPGYSYYGATLLDWLVDRLRNQEGGDGTPLEPVGAYLRDAGRPAQVLAGIGATRYTPFGETGFLRAGDQALVVVYDGRETSPERLVDVVRAGEEDGLVGASVLRQDVG